MLQHLPILVPRARWFDKRSLVLYAPSILPQAPRKVSISRTRGRTSAEASVSIFRITFFSPSRVYRCCAPVSQHDPRRSSSNPRSVGYLINHTAHFNTRRNTLCAARVNEMHHEQTDSYHGLFIIGKSALEAALAQPARYYRLPPHYQATPFVPTFLPS